MSIGGNIQPIKLLRLNAGFFHYTAEQGALPKPLRQRLDGLGQDHADPAYDFELGYTSMMVNDAAQTGTGVTANTVNAFKDTTGATTVVGSGDRNTIYASVFYHLDKQAEVYLAGDYLMLTDNYKVSAPSTARRTRPRWWSACASRCS